MTLWPNEIDKMKITLLFLILILWRGDAKKGQRSWLFLKLGVCEVEVRLTLSQKSKIDLNNPDANVNPPSPTIRHRIVVLCIWFIKRFNAIYLVFLVMLTFLLFSAF